VSAFQACLDVVLLSEGGFVDNPKDPGGATNYGITRATLQAWRRHAVSVDDVATLSESEAASIYHADFWLPICGDQLPGPVALIMFDGAVNCGTNRAAHWLQAAVGAGQDGEIGPDTLAHMRSTIASHSVIAVAGEIHAQRIVFQTSLATWRVFGNGWARRLANLPFQAAVL
jgi:lysozyme family protein